MVVSIEWMESSCRVVDLKDHVGNPTVRTSCKNVGSAASRQCQVPLFSLLMIQTSDCWMCENRPSPPGGDTQASFTTVHPKGSTFECSLFIWTPYLKMHTSQSKGNDKKRIGHKTAVVRAFQRLHYTWLTAEMSGAQQRSQKRCDDGERCALGIFQAAQ